MTPAYKHLINYTLDRGLCISVYMDGECLEDMSADPDMIEHCLELGECSLVVLDADTGQRIASARADIYADNPADTIQTREHCRYLEIWWEHYSEGVL